MSAALEKTEDRSGIAPVIEKLLGTQSFDCERFVDDVAGEHKRYEVYKIVCGGQTYVLKRFDSEKRFETEKTVYGLLEGLPAPRLLGASDSCLLLEFLDGEDLSRASDAGVTAAAESIAAIMNAYPFRRTYDRTLCEKEVAFRESDLACLETEPLLKAAYTAFLARLKEMPLTLAHGDLVPINCIDTGDCVRIIDWEYGGFLPYALDLGRFLAHSGEDETSVYRQTETQKQLFVDTVYRNLLEKPDRAVYDRDVRFAVFSELVMVLRFYLEDPAQERDASFAAYYKRATALARELIETQNSSESSPTITEDAMP